MARESLAFILRYARQLADAEALARLPDGRLLEGFARRGDHAAFAVLAERYAGLVLATCRRLLASEQDVEDAFQATFLVLARRARALDKRRPVGGWLHTVAYRVALKARADAARRRSREVRAAVANVAGAQEPVGVEPPCPFLDEELQRLPEKYRLALVLCYLQGKTNAQAAAELGWPTGSMSRRLARGRELLRRALSQRGVQIPTSLITGAVADAARGAAIRLLPATVEMAFAVRTGGAAAAPELFKRVSALAHPFLKENGMYKLRWLAGILLVLGLAGGMALGQREKPKVEGEKREPSDASTDSGKQHDPQRDGYYKVYIEAEARGTLARSAKGSTVQTVLRVYQSFVPPVEIEDARGKYDLDLDFSRSPELQELAKTHDGKEVVVNGLSELRLIGQRTRSGGYSGPNPPMISVPTWQVHPTVLVTRLRLARDKP